MPTAKCVPPHQQPVILCIDVRRYALLCSQGPRDAVRTCTDALAFLAALCPTRVVHTFLGLNTLHSVQGNLKETAADVLSHHASKRGAPSWVALAQKQQGLQLKSVHTRKQCVMHNVKLWAYRGHCRHHRSASSSFSNAQSSFCTCREPTGHQPLCGSSHRRHEAHVGTCSPPAGARRAPDGVRPLVPLTVNISSLMYCTMR